jgi:nicotinamidase-related amidase
MPWATTARNHLPLPEPPLRQGDTALMVIDMQYFDAHPDHGMGLFLKNVGRYPEAAYYFEEVAKIVPRIAALQKAFREQRMELIHTRVKAMTKNGRDITQHHKAKGHRYIPGTLEVEFLPELAPEGDEIVLDKTTTSCFTSTGLDGLLRNVGIRTLVIAGVDTCYCVESTVREAADRGFSVVLVGDATATSSPEIQRFALNELDNDFCVVRSTDWVLAQLGAIATQRERGAVGATNTGG